MAKVLVTGAAGFLGFHLCERMLRDGHWVVGVDNLQTGQQSNIDDLCQHASFTFFKADVIDLNQDKIAQMPALNQSLHGISRIYHMACPASPPLYQKDPLHTLDTCYVGSRNMFEIAKATRARILIASTSEVYGDPLVHPQPETYWGNVNSFGLRSCYDEGKRVMESLGLAYSMNHDVAVRVARIFNTYGPRMSPHDGRVLTNFITQALAGKNLTIYGDGSQTRSFCFYSDLVDGLVRLMESDVREPVNLGSQFEFSILELAQTVIELVNPKLKVEYQPLPSDDPKLRRPDTTRAKSLLGWEPKVELRTGVSRMAEYFRGIKAK